MNLPTPKQRNKHYQCIRAKADGWDIEGRSDESKEWSLWSNPSFFQGYEYRIVQDENGWLPWYATEDSVRPVGVADKVSLIFSDKDFREGVVGYTGAWSSRVRDTITHYRPHKERKLVKTVKYFNDGTTETN